MGNFDYSPKAKGEKTQKNIPQHTNPSTHTSEDLRTNLVFITVGLVPQILAFIKLTLKVLSARPCGCGAEGEGLEVLQGPPRAVMNLFSEDGAAHRHSQPTSPHKGPVINNMEGGSTKWQKLQVGNLLRPPSRPIINNGEGESGKQENCGSKTCLCCPLPQDRVKLVVPTPSFFF